jgi:hypothetical protein
LANFLALSSVTATISYILEEVNKDVSGIKITTKPLDALEFQNPTNGLNILLYHIIPSANIDSIDPLMKDSSGNISSNPVLGLDLHYLITASASENNDIVAQQILASAMRILNEHPVLPRDTIRKATRGKEGLESSDLADQLDDIELSIEHLSMEDLSKIWSAFPETNFRPSVGYHVRVVLLESKMVGPPPIIRAVKLDRLFGLKTPVIERVEPQILEYSPKTKIVLLGQNLRASNISVEFNGDLVIKPEKPDDVSDRRVIISIPHDLSPGILRVGIIHHLGANDTNHVIDSRNALKSNVSPFVLAPKIISPRDLKLARGSDCTIEFEPSISEEQNVNVLLGDSVFFATPIKNSQKVGKSNSAKFTIPKDLPLGVYLLKLRIDGAESMLQIDENPRSHTFMKPVAPYIEVIS